MQTRQGLWPANIGCKSSRELRHIYSYSQLSWDKYLDTQLMPRYLRVLSYVATAIKSDKPPSKHAQGKNEDAETSSIQITAIWSHPTVWVRHQSI